MRDAFYIDGIDIYDRWKMSVSEGGYNQFICLPSMKDVETNDWNEYDGIEADLSHPVGNARTFSIDFHCLGSYSDIKSFLSYLRTPYVDADEENHGVYHTLKSDEIGGKQIVARIVSLGNTDLGAMRSPLLLSVTFSDDSGFVYDETVSIPVAPSVDSSDFSIDGMPFTAFGIKMLEGTIDSIASGTSVKEGLSVNVADEPGVIYDTEAYQKRRSKNITLKCHMKADSLTSLWNGYLSLENLLFKPGSRSIKIAALGVLYVCHYSTCSVRNFFPGDAWLDFDLTFKVLGLQ